MKTKLEEKQKELIDHYKDYTTGDILSWSETYMDEWENEEHKLESEIAELEDDEFVKLYTEPSDKEKVLFLPQTGNRGELYEILWKHATNMKGDETMIPVDEIDSIIDDILALSTSKQPNKSAEEILAAYIITPDSKREVVTSYQVIHFDDALKAMKEHREQGMPSEEEISEMASIQVSRYLKARNNPTADLHKRFIQVATWVITKWKGETK